MSPSAAEVAMQNKPQEERTGIAAQDRHRLRAADFILPFVVPAVGLLAWHFCVRAMHSDLFPAPLDVARGIIELIQKGLLLKYIVASLFRVTWGFTLAVLIGVPGGLLLGWYGRAFQAFNPIIQIMRPISPSRGFRSRSFGLA